MYCFRLYAKAIYVNAQFLTERMENYQIRRKSSNPVLFRCFLCTGNFILWEHSSTVFTNCILKWMNMVSLQLQAVFILFIFMRENQEYCNV